MPSSEASPRREPKPDLSTWPTHTEAAQRLGTNERTIHRWIASGRLRRDYRPATGRKPIVVVDPEDLEQIRRERLPPVVLTGDHDGRTQHVQMLSESVEVERARGADPFAGLAAHLARLAAHASSAMPGPFVGLADAVAISGMPASWLLAQARAGVPWAINVGTGKKAFWRFSIASHAGRLK